MVVVGAPNENDPAVAFEVVDVVVVVFCAPNENPLAVTTCGALGAPKSGFGAVIEVLDVVMVVGDFSLATDPKIGSPAVEAPLNMIPLVMVDDEPESPETVVGADVVVFVAVVEVEVVSAPVEVGVAKADMVKRRSFEPTCTADFANCKTHDRT